MNLIRFNKIWALLILTALIFSALYIYYVLFPGNVSYNVYKYFSHFDIARARDYNKANRVIYISEFIIKAIFLTWFVFGYGAIKLSGYTNKISYGSYYINIIIYFAILWITLRLLSLPFNLYSHAVQVYWGFSTQSMPSWWSDYIKSALLDLIISGFGVLLFFFAANRWPKTWWIPASIFLTIMLFIQNLLWPLVIAPIFNKFTPVKDPAIISMVNDISKNAGINIDKVEIMDASKRTNLANAYFYGFGKNSKIVLYDTLLLKYPKDEVKAVIAHEAGHWKENHVLKSILIGAVSLFFILYILNILLSNTLLIPYGKKITPAAISIIYLFILLINFDTQPIQNYISRQMERKADLLSVQYLHDKKAVVKLQIDLAKKSLSDVEPPAFIEWFSYSHPSTMHRIESVKNFDIKK